MSPLRRLGDPFARQSRHVAVVARVRGFAGAEVRRKLLRRRERRGRGAQQAGQPSHPVVDVHGNDLTRKAVVVLGAPEVELAHRHHLVTRVEQPGAPSLDRAVVRRRAVPGADLVRIPAGREARPRRNADGRVRVGVRKPDAAPCQSVEIGRARDLVAVAAGDVAVVLIRENDHGIGRAHGEASGFPVFSVCSSGAIMRAGTTTHVGRNNMV